MNKYKLLRRAINEILKGLIEHPVNWPHSHVTATCYACENTVISSHTTEWSLNPAASNVNYCNDPIAAPPIGASWWSDDEQWVIDNICAYQDTSLGTSFDCYGCDNGQIISQPGFTNSGQGANNMGVCGTITINGDVITLYDDQNHSDLADCGATLSTTCDQSAWSGYSSWLSTFTSLPNFSSSNPNQPCNLLCKKLSTWTNKLANVNQNQTETINRLNCKIEKVQELMDTHDCINSNAPKCNN
tara:strand:- start:302 stop:1033 length:732 start_codon:yes stop_codon:yes gene_type:complete